MFFINAFFVWTAWLSLLSFALEQCSLDKRRSVSTQKRYSHFQHLGLSFLCCLFVASVISLLGARFRLRNARGVSLSRSIQVPMVPSALPRGRFGGGLIGEWAEWACGDDTPPFIKASEEPKEDRCSCMVFGFPFGRSPWDGSPLIWPLTQAIPKTWLLLGNMFYMFAYCEV